MNRQDPSQWKDKLSPEQFAVCWQKGTEPPFSGQFVAHKASGTYICVCCKAPLFQSSTKFDSGTGWPSFWEAATTDSLQLITDHSHGLVRTEVCCNQCGAHLGHVFDDGPVPTGKRYCINSLSLDFISGE